ncbi:unnamed protein product [Urochloa humidicola]
MEMRPSSSALVLKMSEHVVADKKKATETAHAVIKESETVQQTGAKRIMLTQAPAGIYKPPSDANDCQQGANDTFK